LEAFSCITLVRSDYLLFGSVFIYIKIKLKLLFLKKTETSSNRPVSVWFFRIKTGSNRFGSVFFCFFRFWFVFWFQAYKTKPVGFFKILIYLIGFFSRFGFFSFFSGFLDLIGFLVFLLTSNFSSIKIL
jgi:hypothetical protein